MENCLKKGKLVDGDKIDHLGVNLEGGKIGCVVPAYMDIDSVEDLTREADQTMIGIEEGSATVAAAKSVLENFHWELEDIESVMLDIHAGANPNDATRDWVDENEAKISE